MGFSGKNTGEGCHFLLQAFLTQGWKLYLLQWQAGSLPLSHLGSPADALDIYKNVSPVQAPSPVPSPGNVLPVGIRGHSIRP